MLILIHGTFRLLFKLLVNSLSGILLVVIILLPIYIKSLPDLNIWHTEILESEFQENSDVGTFQGYQELEKDLFAELEEKINNKLPLSKQTILNRFHTGSLSNPDFFDVNWNHSFVLPAPSPKAGVLLLHGMSDSPYSLRHMGQQLNKEGAHVVGLRLPGHGTAPSGLLKVEWEDMAAAVRLAMCYLEKTVPGKPLYIIGFSTGAALGLHYALSSLEAPSLKQASGLVLISPAIGVSDIAVMAQFKEKLSSIPGFEKMAWNGIIPEYNPYKYNSFAVNAGDQVYRLTKEINRLLRSAQKNNSLKHLPDLLAFQSIVDATVSTVAIVDVLFNKLPKTGHELVVFDINRTFNLKSLINKDPVPTIHKLLKKTNLTFTLGFITNMYSGGRDVFLHEKKPDDSTETKRPLDLTWPMELYSLSHVALPFPKKDPLYGTAVPGYTGLNLGDIPLKGERGILRFPASEIIRLKWNPFYSYMEDRIFQMVFNK